MSTKKMYVGGTENQFVFSSDKNFVERYSTPSFVYYKDSEASNIKDFPEEWRLKKIEKYILQDNLTPEFKNNLAHCFLCVKWMLINNAYKYCDNCQYNPNKVQKELNKENNNEK